MRACSSSRVMTRTGSAVEDKPNMDSIIHSTASLFNRLNMKSHKKDGGADKSIRLDPNNISSPHVAVYHDEKR